MNPVKRRHRELKREIKRAGQKHVRQQIKRVLTECPEEAAEFDGDFGRYRSVELNGIDQDAKRKREIAHRPIQGPDFT